MDKRTKQLFDLRQIKSQINAQLEIWECLQTDIYYNSREGEGYFSTQSHIETQIRETIRSLIGLIGLKMDKELMDANLVHIFINDVLHKIEKRSI